MQNVFSKFTVSFFSLVVIPHIAFAAVNQVGRVTPPAQIAQKSINPYVEKTQIRIQSEMLRAKYIQEKSQNCSDVVAGCQKRLAVLEKFIQILHGWILKLNNAEQAQDTDKCLDYESKIDEMYRGMDQELKSIEL